VPECAGLISLAPGHQGQRDDCRPTHAAWTKQKPCRGAARDVG
jgi:hypothetical protein